MVAKVKIMESVALIEPVGGHGGMNYYDLGLARGLYMAGCRVIVYTSDETIVPGGIPFEVKKSFLGIWGKGLKVHRILRFVKCLISTLSDAKKNGLSIAHYHFFHYTLLEEYCVKIARVYGFKVVVTAHDVESFGGNRNTRKAYKILAYADKVIAHNKVSKQELVDRILLQPSLISVVPHGNYLDSIEALPEKNYARKGMGISENDKVILFFGQIKKVKGLDILLSALPEVITKYKDLKLVIAGRVWREDFADYVNIINKYGIEDSVIAHIRYIKDSEVASYYQAADLVVLPYRRIYQSGVLLMAMSYRKPVLTSDIPGMIEIVSDGKNGFVFRSGNVGSLSSKMIDILSDDEALERVGEAGYQTVLKEHGWERIGQMTCELYNTISDD